jgi:16S rRNA (adenine(1408)-N(1))-methyltransferase
MAALGASELAIDIGTGDGLYVYRSARAEPKRLYIGIDSNAENLAEVSRKAARKPAKGGAPNALFVRAAAEALPEELAGLADRVTIQLPWGGLLHAVMAPDVAVLRGIRALCRPGASLLVVAGEPITDAVVPAYRAAGFAAQVAPMAAAEVQKLRTTWAARLAFGRPRVFSQIAACAIIEP